MKTEILKAVEQILSESRRVRYGEAVIRIVFHDGKIKALEKSIIEKIISE